MAQSDILQSNSVNTGDWQNLLPDAAAAPGEPPAWLVASVAEFRLTQRILNLVRPIRAALFGGILVFATLLTLLLQHSPDGQTVLVAASLWGLPICLTAWFAASSAQKRLIRRKHRIEQRVYGMRMHVDDQGRVLTDNPHPVLILDPTTESLPTMS